NGTHVNGLRISEKDLSDGDAISVGSAAIIFHTGEPPKPVPRLPDPADFKLPLEDRNVRILLRTVVTAASIQDLALFLPMAVDNIIEIANAERGILFVPDGAGKLKPLVARDSARKPLLELTG